MRLLCISLALLGGCSFAPLHSSVQLRQESLQALEFAELLRFVKSLGLNNLTFTVDYVLDDAEAWGEIYQAMRTPNIEKDLNLMSSDTKRRIGEKAISFLSSKFGRGTANNIGATVDREAIHVVTMGEWVYYDYERPATTKGIHELSMAKLPENSSRQFVLNLIPSEQGTPTFPFASGKEPLVLTFTQRERESGAKVPPALTFKLWLKCDLNGDPLLKGDVCFGEATVGRVLARRKEVTAR